jgi:hypothetical protein
MRSIDVIERFDLYWDLQTDYKSFHAACLTLNVPSLDPLWPPQQCAEAHLAAYVRIGRCLL